LCTARESTTFSRSRPLQNHVLDRIAVGHADHVLLDDRPFVERRRHVMAGSTNQFHAARKCLMVWFRTHKCQSERIMNIYHAQQIMTVELRPEDLHIAREHHQIYILPDQIQHLPLGFAFVFWVAQQLKRNSVKISQPPGGGMVANDYRDVASQLPGTLPV